MAEQKKYVDQTGLGYVLGKLRDKNAELFLGRMAEAASAAKVKSTLTINGEAFDGSEAKVFNLSESGHEHVAANITDFKDAVKKVISDAGGTSHTHINLTALETITDTRLSAWDAKVGVDDVAKLKYSNSGMTGAADVKGALDILVKNAQINAAALTDTSANMNGLATRLTQAEKDIDAAEKDIDTLETKVADLEAANAEGGAVANAIKDAKDAAVAAQAAADAAAAAVVTEKERAMGVEGGLQTAIDAINNTDTGILAQAKAYTDAREEVLDGKITKAQSAADKAQGEVDALEGVVGNKTDLADADTVFGKIAKAQAQADKGVQDAATEKSRAEGVEAGLRTDLGQATDAAKADGSAFARIAQVKADLAAEVTRAGNAEKAVDDKAEANKAAIEVLNGADTVEGSVDKKIKDAITQVNTAAGNLEGRVAANEAAIEVINGDGDGSIKKAVANLVDGAPGAMDTLKELADAITAHQEVYDAYIKTVASNIATAKQEAITEAGKLDTTLHNTITGEIATAKTEAISAAAQDAASKDTALENKLQANIDKKVDKTVYDAKVAELAQADTDNLAAAKKYADDEDAKIEAILGHKAVDGGEAATGLCADVAANAAAIAAEQQRAVAAEGALSDRIAAFEGDGEGSVAAQVKAVADDLAGYKTTQAAKDEAQDGKITAVEGRLDVIEGEGDGSIKKAVSDAKTEIKATTDGLDGRVTTLEGKVGDDAKGLVKDVADLKATVGDDSDGLVNRVNALEAINAGNRLDAAETDIDNLQAAVAAIGTITEAEIDDILGTVYGTQA